VDFCIYTIQWMPVEMGIHLSHERTYILHTQFWFPDVVLLFISQQKFNDNYANVKVKCISFFNIFLFFRISDKQEFNDMPHFCNSKWFIFSPICIWVTMKTLWAPDHFDVLYLISLVLWKLENIQYSLKQLYDQRLCEQTWDYKIQIYFSCESKLLLDLTINKCKKNLFSKTYLHIKCYFA
jgi:hypothetical protein